MMDIAGENMARKIFLDPIFQGEKCSYYYSTEFRIYHAIKPCCSIVLFPPFLKRFAQHDKSLIGKLIQRTPFSHDTTCRWGRIIIS